MNFLKTPNIPNKKVENVLMDGRVSEKLEYSINSLGIEVIKTLPHIKLYNAVCYHPDMMFHHVENNTIIYAPQTHHNTLEILKEKGFILFQGETQLGKNYPNNISYNVARVGKYAIHNFKYTDKILCKHLESQGVEFINVNQGYAKCSISIVNENSIITEDCGIAKTLAKNGFNVLLIEPEKSIMLPGLSHGFIGGCSGLISSNIWALTGDATTLNAYRTIRNFLYQKGIELLSLTDEPIQDVGSIIPLY